MRACSEQEVGLIESLIPDDDMTVLELLDRVVDKGVYLRGDLTIAVADIDLLYIGLQAIVSSVSRLAGGMRDGPPVP